MRSIPSVKKPIPIDGGYVCYDSDEGIEEIEAGLLVPILKFH